MGNQTIAEYVKRMRRETGLTQVDLSEKAGVGLRFVRELEQGKESLRLDKVNQVLSLFGRVMKKAEIYVSNQLAGILIEDENGFSFTYTDEYISKGNRRPVSLTLPITHVPYTSSVLFPFFDGLIPEGWLLDIAEQSWKISSRDRMALLLACCKDCIGDSTLLLDYGKF